MEVVKRQEMIVLQDGDDDVGAGKTMCAGKGLGTGRYWAAACKVVFCQPDLNL